MTRARILRPAPRALVAALVAALALLAAGTGALAESGDPPTTRGPLDGMAFVGKIGPEGAPDLDDVLSFDDGHFWSAACIKCGFAPSHYWVRHVGEAIEFRGVLESRERGEFTYRGVVRGESIRVEIEWRRERWYGTVDRDLVFQGRLAPPGEAEPSLERAMQRAAAGPPDPDACPS